MTEVIDRYKLHAFQRGGLLLFSPQHAIDIIRELETKSIKLLGLDAFHITENSTQPLMEHSIDVSNQETAWETAIKFLEKRINSGLVFEIVADE